MASKGEIEPSYSTHIHSLLSLSPDLVYTRTRTCYFPCLLSFIHSPHHDCFCLLYYRHPALWLFLFLPPLPLRIAQRLLCGSTIFPSPLSCRSFSSVVFLFQFTFILRWLLLVDGWEGSRQVRTASSSSLWRCILLVLRERAECSEVGKREQGKEREEEAQRLRAFVLVSLVVPACNV